MHREQTQKPQPHVSKWNSYALAHWEIHGVGSILQYRFTYRTLTAAHNMPEHFVELAAQNWLLMGSNQVRIWRQSSLWRIKNKRSEDQTINTAVSTPVWGLSGWQPLQNWFRFAVCGKCGEVFYLIKSCCLMLSENQPGKNQVLTPVPYTAREVCMHSWCEYSWSSGVYLLS